MQEDDVKHLKELTGVGFLQTKRTLIQAEGNFDKAFQILKDEEFEIARKRTAKITRYSTLGHYMHANHQAAVLVEVCCESDTTASSQLFNALADDIAMHITATGCMYVSKSDVPSSVVDRMLLEPNGEEGLELFYRTNCLLEQPYYRDGDLSVGDLVLQFIYTNKENIFIKRFVLYEASRMP